MKTLITIWLTVISYSSITFSQAGSDNEIFEIKFEEALKAKPTLLSLIATEVKYIQLETNENCLISGFASYIFSDSLIFISDRDQILKFSSDGKFLKRIGEPGRGPGEINSIRTTSIIPNKRLIAIHDASMRKMLYFSFDGRLIKTIDLPRLNNVKVMDDGRYIGYDQGVKVSEEYTFCITNESGEIITGVKNYNPWKNPSGAFIQLSINSSEPFYTYQDKYYFKGLYNDTVYSFDGNKISPSYFINLGQYKLPYEKIPERLSREQAQSFNTYGSNYQFANIFESGGIIFLKCFGIRSSNYLTFKKSDYNSTYRSFTNTTKGLILNDWDGGMYFWPEGKVNDTHVFMPINIVRLKKFIDFTKSGKIPIKYPEQRKQLESTASKLDIADNPILMLVTLKP